MGLDYAYISVKQRDNKIYVSITVCKNADNKNPENEGEVILINNKTIYFKVKVAADAVCSFSYSDDGIKFGQLGEPFTARPGKWIGAKVGLFCVRQGTTNDAGFADIDWFRIDK
jgi:hypothetical protein